MRRDSRGLLDRRSGRRGRRHHPLEDLQAQKDMELLAQAVALKSHQHLMRLIGVRLRRRSKGQPRMFHNHQTLLALRLAENELKEIIVLHRMHHRAHVSTQKLSGILQIVLHSKHRRTTLDGRLHPSGAPPVRPNIIPHQAMSD